MEYTVTNFLTPKVKVAHWNKDKKIFDMNVTFEAFCYRNPDYHEECEVYTYKPVPPLGYEVFRYSLITAATEGTHEVASDGFDGLYRDQFTVFDLEEDKVVTAPPSPGTPPPPPPPKKTTD